MKTSVKLFIATSSFSLNLNKFKKNKNFNRYKILMNPVKKKLSKNQLIKFAKDSEIIIAGTETYDSEVLSKLKKLKFIFRMGSGTDNINLKYLKENKIGFAKSKITPEVAVAELIVGYILSFYRNLHEHDQNLKNKIWKKKMGSLLKGKTIGIIGYGKVGKYLDKIIKNFGVQILINDVRKINKKNTKLETLIKLSDIISININHMSKKKILTKQKLSLCKKDNLIINTSRSEVMDNKYLYKLLKTGKILGACMDVYDQEPYYGEFTKLDNVILTPHIGSYSKEIRYEMEKEAFNSILNI